MTHWLADCFAGFCIPEFQTRAALSFEQRVSTHFPSGLNFASTTIRTPEVVQCIALSEIMVRVRAAFSSQSPKRNPSSQTAKEPSDRGSLS